MIHSLDTRIDINSIKSIYNHISLFVFRKNVLDNLQFESGCYEKTNLKIDYFDQNLLKASRCCNLTSLKISCRVVLIDVISQNRLSRFLSNFNKIVKINLNSCAKSRVKNYYCSEIIEKNKTKTKKHP